MSALGNHTLGIIEYRNIVKTINETWDIDFGNYAFTSFCGRVEKVIRNYNLNGADDLVERIKDDNRFFDIFINALAVDETEMFRDPALWRELRDTIIPKIISTGDNRIWMPSITSGEELYSLLIVLNELKLTQKIQVLCTSFTQQHIDDFKRGTYSLKKMEINNANYKRYKGKFQLSNYYTIQNNEAKMDEKLFDCVEFKVHNLFKDKLPGKIKLLVYRNRMIYFNKKLQCEVINLLHQSLLPGGHFVIGIKENIDTCNADKKFILVNATERIYKKSYA